MKVPNFPTDSLYKFMAIFGLSLFIFGGYTYFQNIYNKAILENNLLIEEISVINSPKLTTSLMKDLYTDIKSLQEDVKTSSKDSLDSELLKLNLLEERHEDLIDLRRGLAFANKLKQANNELNVTKLRSSIYISFGFMVLGVVISYLGFHYWHLRIQVYQDELIKKESDRFTNNKAIYVHELQFRKEFEAYEQLWPKLEMLVVQGCDLKETLSDIEQKNVTGSKKLSEFISLLHATRKSLRMYRPFLPLELYNSIKKATEVALEIEESQESDSIILTHNLAQWSDKVDQDLEKVMSEIHQRIGLLQVSD